MVELLLQPSPPDLLYFSHTWNTALGISGFFGTSFKNNRFKRKRRTKKTCYTIIVYAQGEHADSSLNYTPPSEVVLAETVIKGTAMLWRNFINQNVQKNWSGRELLADAETAQLLPNHVCLVIRSLDEAMATNNLLWGSSEDTWYLSGGLWCPDSKNQSYPRQLRHLKN